MLMILIFGLCTILNMTRQTSIHPNLGEKANKETSKARNTETNKQTMQTNKSIKPIIAINGRNLKAMNI